MKKIEAIIKPFKLADVRKAIVLCGAKGLTVTEVKGIGNQMGHVELSTDFDDMADLVPKLKLDIVIKDDLVQPCVEAIEKVAKTGKIGDGKIFVSDIEQVVRIRTSERDQDAL
ncbi:P-II family nitrogen regulator [Microbulbifer magnicolonia]|uniref:P-II family nitrogen regulator n=1 Tax=Microbulbifer magnicolonia TaxID=3109744 RepID=UPI002B402EC1|nr:P-II family nitrogen regulator [Microbulbifer sp. GG15]